MRVGGRLTAGAPLDKVGEVSDEPRKPFSAPNQTSDTGSRVSRRKFFKFAAVLVAIFVFGGTAVYFGVFSSDFWQGIQEEIAARRIWNELQAQNRREAADPYGGKTPQEVYQLFVQALEKQDIELAVKYFSFDKQEEMEVFLADVQNRGKWQPMYDALSGKSSRVIEYEKLTEDWYAINVRGQTGLIMLFHVKRNPNNNLWKLTEFW